MAEQIRFDISDREIDGDEYFAVIEPVFWSVSIYDGPDQYERDLARFSNEQRLGLAYHWYLSEVNNGGHDQFYYNSTGIVWPDALSAFVAIGAEDVAAIIRASASRCAAFDSYMVQDSTNMHLVETPVQSSQSPQRQLGDCSRPTYQESPFNLCARSAQRNQAKTLRRRLVGRLYIEHQSILRRAARDETLGRMCVGRI